MLSKLLKKKPSFKDDPNENNNITKTPEQIQFASESVKRTASLGQGDFGTVYRGECYCDSVIERIFVKEVRVKSGFESELALLASLQHPLLLQVLGYYEDTFYRKKYVLSLNVEKEPMDIYLRGYQLNRKDYADTHHQRKLAAWAIDIASAMKYLHSHNVIHGDLAAHNILMILAPDCTLKLTDFGLWKIAEPSSIDSRTHKWAAPEVREEGYYSTKSDIWSYGVVLWQIFSWGAEPYAELQEPGSKSLFQQPLAQPLDCPEEIYKVMLDCWKLKPEERPYFDELVESLSRIQKELKNALRPNQGNLLPGLTALKMTLPKQLGSESDFEQLGWYGRIGRSEAEKLLLKTPSGTYLIRWSEKENSYVLSSKQGEIFSHVSGLLASEDSFLVETTQGQMKFNRATDYLQYMKKQTPGISKSIHEVTTPAPVLTRTGSRSSVVVYANDDTDGLYVNEDKPKTDGHNQKTEDGKKGNQDDFPSVYVNS